MEEEWNAFEKQCMENLTPKEIGVLKRRTVAFMKELYKKTDDRLNDAYSSIAEGQIMIDTALAHASKVEKEMQVIQYIMSKL